MASECVTVVERHSRTPHKMTLDAKEQVIVQYYRELEQDQSFDNVTPHQLAQEGKVEELKMMAKMLTLTLKGVDNDGRTLLHVAAVANQCEMMKYLISCGNDLNAVDNNGDTALHLAVSNRHIEATQTLLSHEADDTILNKQSDAPLHIAARNDHGAMVAAMLQYPINVVVEGLRKRTPMHVAAENDSIEVVKVLHNHIASDKNKNSCFRLCAKDEDALSPIHLAARKGAHRVLECMMNYGKDHGYTAEQVFGFLDEENNTPLHTAVDGGHDEVVRVLLAHGASPIESNKNHLPPIHLACSQGKLKMVELMVQYGGADVITCRDAFGQTPLHSSTLPPSTSVLCYLINIGAQLNVCNNQGQTPLITATLSGNLAAVKLLLKSGADPMVRDQQGENPLHYGIQRNRKSIAKCFLEHPAAQQMLIEANHSGTSPVHCALQQGFSDIVSEMLGLLEKCPSLEHRDKDGNNYLHLAALGGDWKTLTAILEFLNCHTFLNEVNKYGSTPLHLATHGGHQRCVEILLSHGAMAHKCMRGLTPYLLACFKGHAECAKILYEAHPFQKNWSNDEGNTALHMAALAGSPACVSLALDIGVPLTHNNKQESFFDIIINRVDSESALAVIQHDRWSECLKFRSPLHPHPMVGLVSKLPEVAKAVLDRCHTKSPLPRDHLEYWESYSFEHLKIHNDVESTVLNNDSEKNADPMELDHSMALSTGISSTISNSPKDQQPYDILCTMVKLKRNTLISHKVVGEYIIKKWNAYGSFVFAMSLILSFLQVLFLSIFAKTAISYSQNNTQNVTTNNYLSASSAVIAIITLLFTTFRAVWILLYFIRYGYHVLNIGDIQNLQLWIGGAGVITSYIFLISPIVRGYDGIILIAGSLAVFFGWLEVALELSLFDLFGIYVVMFIHVSKSLFLVLVICLPFFLAFGLAIYIVGSGDPNFTSLGFSLVTAFSYLSGQPNFEQFISDQNTGALSNPPLVFLLAVLVAVVLGIGFNNLLTGLAVGDTKKVQDSALVHRRMSHINIFINLERAMPQCLRRKFNFVEHKTYPNKRVPPLQKKRRQLWRTLKAMCQVEDEDNDSEGPTEERSETRYSDNRLKQLEIQMEEIASRQEKVLELIQHLKVPAVKNS